MKTALSLFILMLAVGTISAFYGKQEWAREEAIANQATLRLNALRTELDQQEKGDSAERKRLQEGLMALSGRGFFQKPTPANFRVLQEPGMQGKMEEEREDENGIATGFVTFTWQVKHMVDFATRLQALQGRWQESSTPSPAPLLIEQCRFSRALAGLAVVCRARWQAARWPGEAMPKGLPEKRESLPLPSLGRLFFTPEERIRGQGQKVEPDGWQGLLRREQAGKTLIWKDGLFMETENALPEDVGGRTGDLLRGGEIRKSGGRE